MTTRTYVLGVDPGTTTGMALLLVDERETPLAVWSAELPWDEATDALAHRLGELRVLRESQPATAAVAVGEMYQLNAKTWQRGQQMADDSIGMLGVLRREARLTGVELAPEQPPSAKGSVKDLILRNLKLYAPGLGHVNDAYRHAVVLAIKRRLIPGRVLLRGMDDRT